MATEEERCAEAKKFQRIDDAFHAGDLEALRAAVDDPAVVPNGRMPDTIGSCLVYAIYHSPLAFIRTLLEAGADPDAPVADAFPPLIAALGCTRAMPGATRRTDVDDIIRLLLSFGANPNQRGISDYTPLHMAVAVRDVLAIQMLLGRGADPELRTRIDEYETPLEMAEAAGLADIAAMFYGVEGMRVGGTRRLEIGPHLAYGDRGVPGVIPAGAVLTAEVTILEARDWPTAR